MVAADIVKAKADLVETHPNITVYRNAAIEEIEGYIGTYKVTLKPNGGGPGEPLDISNIIVATGMKEIEPEGVRVNN